MPRDGVGFSVTAATLDLNGDLAPDPVHTTDGDDAIFGTLAGQVSRVYLAVE